MRCWPAWRVNRTGQAQGSMGIDAGDVDGDGDEDLFVTNLDNEGNTLYLNLGQGLFEDRTIEARSASTASGFTGFGTRFIDLRQRRLARSARRQRRVSLLEAVAPYPLAANQLFRNDGGRRFIDVTETAGPAFKNR